MRFFDQVFDDPAKIGATIAGPPGVALGAATGIAGAYVGQVASKLGADWKPVVFGDWQRDKIEKILQGRKDGA